MAASTGYLARYVASEHEQVWAELQSLGAAVREEPVYTDALAVARETMRRVRHNIEMLITIPLPYSLKRHRSIALRRLTMQLHKLLARHAEEEPITILATSKLHTAQSPLLCESQPLLQRQGGSVVLIDIRIDLLIAALEKIVAQREHDGLKGIALPPVLFPHSDAIHERASPRLRLVDQEPAHQLAPERLDLEAEIVVIAALFRALCHPAAGERA